LGVSIGLFGVFSNQLKTSSLRKAELEQNIKALQATEQRLVLIKDRLSLIKEVMGRETAADELEAISTLISNLPEGVSMGEAQLEENETLVSMTAQDSLALTQMMSVLVSSDAYSQVDLRAIKFSPTSGFAADFELVK
jgi:hypothetical protein